MELKRSGGTTTTAATAATAAGEEEKVVKKIGKPVFRHAGGDRWEDKSLGEWPENDYRIFVGDLGMEVNDDMLTKAFAKYPTFQKAKVIKDKSSGKSKGFGFVSLMEPGDYAKVRRRSGGKWGMGNGDGDGVPDAVVLCLLPCMLSPNRNFFFFLCLS